MDTDSKILYVLALMIPLTIRFLAWKEGISRFPDIKYPTEAVFAGNFTDGSPCKPEDYEGKVVVLYFWSVLPCPFQDELQKTLPDLYQQYHDQGLEIIVISDCSDPQEIKKFITQNDLPWKVMSSHEIISKGNSVSMYYMTGIVPDIIVVGRNGKIVSRDVRETTGLVEIVEKELKRKKQN